jgi:hypothetical protein
MLMAGQFSISVDLSGFDPHAAEFAEGWGSLSAPGYPQLPVRTVNVILPPGAAEIAYTHQFSELATLAGPRPSINPGFSDGERILAAPPASLNEQLVEFTGLAHWGDVCYAGFRVLPAIWDGSTWQAYQKLQLNLSWTDASAAAANRVPPVLSVLEKSRTDYLDTFFANPRDLSKYYVPSAAKNYDYLIVSTPELYAAVSPLETFRQSQGLITAFADINTILASSPGATDGEKLRNYLVGQYNSSPFSYLLLIGDYNIVPVMNLTPEPDGMETVASDFFYGDLSSIVDTDNDGILGEYSPGAGLQDYLCDFTPEVFVGRISNNNAVSVSQIAARTVAFEQSNAPWKHSALLPAAYLNYGGEPETIYLQTDGATFMEYAKDTVLSDWQCTTMYEQTGFLPSYPSDLDLDYDILKNQLSSTSYGILNWSAHGSSTSSSRKVWMNDGNANLLPDSFEMQWFDMVDKYSFNNLANPDGMIIFAASCYNGMIDGNQSCLAEHALQQKAVNVSAATRTGWYKIGWANPGWGGLSSYNLHWLENVARNQMTVGAAQAFANLTHTQYYLFGDPVDTGGIIWPELQNVYTYLLYGDPAVGYFGQQNYTNGEILVYEPLHHNGLPIVNALNEVGHFNVVYTDKLIPDYDYINQFEAVFCLFGWGDTAYVLDPDSLDYALLNSYLENGGKLYLEGDVAWDPQDPFWGKFATHAPLDYFAYIEALQTTQNGHIYSWDYDDAADPYTQILVPYTPEAEVLFTTMNTQYPDQTIGILNDTGTYATIASSFALADVDDSAPFSHPFTVLLGIILDKLGVIDYIPVAADDPLSPPALLTAAVCPNPFAAGTSLRVTLDRAADLRFEVFNLRGQKVRAIEFSGLARGSHDLSWDGCDGSNRSVSPGIYLWRVQNGKTTQQGKMLKLTD